MDRNYSIVIQWSENDNCFVASLPEWKNQNAHGKTYEAVLANAQQTLTSLIESALAQGKSLPEPKSFKIPTVSR